MSECIRFHLDEHIDPEHFGIAYCKQGTRSIGTIIRRLLQVYEQLNSEEMKGRIQYL